MPFQKGQPRPEGAGRKKGSKNRILGKTVEEILAGGESPLEFLIRTMHNEENDYLMRLDAAKHAAPYMHSKLASIDVNGSLDSTVVIVHDWRGKQQDEGQG